MIEKKLPDGTVVDAYPITQAQSIMYYIFNSYGGNKPVLNIGTGYYWQGDMDVEKFRESLYEAIARCDTMRLRFVQDRQYGLLQYIVPETEIKVEEVDLSGMPYEEAHKVMKGWTYGMIDMFVKPLHTVKIIHLADNYHGMYIKFHHLAMDGYSAKIFLSDVMAIYLSKTEGMPYPKPMKPYLEAVKQELSYLDSEKRKEDRQYFIDTFTHDRENEPIFNDYLLDNRLYKQRELNNAPEQRFVNLHEGDHPEALSLYFEEDAELTEKVLEKCQNEGLSIACVLMAGLRTALSSFNRNEEDVSFKLMVNRRGSLLEKRSGGIRLHFFTIRTIVKEDMTFAEAVAEIEKAQNEIFKHSSFHTLEMYQLKHVVMKMGSLDQTYDPMSFSYQPYMETPCQNEEVRKTTRGVWYNNDVSMQPLYLTVKHRTNDKGFEFIYEYRTDCSPENDLKILHSKLMKTVELGTNDPGMKMGEILKQLN